MKKINIAIDGPSGAGKSTLARKIAASFGFIYVDTGAIYRCVGLQVLLMGLPSKDASAVSAILGDIRVELSYDDSGLQRMFLNGRDVTEEIRKPEVSVAASNVSAIPEVRRFLLNMQRELAKKYNVIMDGRDIGTVVLPNADLKIFLTASTEDRALRRYHELLERGHQAVYEDVLRDMKYRDTNDSTRAVAPLKPAEDAYILDTTGNSFEESFALVKAIVEDMLCKLKK